MSSKILAVFILVTAAVLILLHLALAMGWVWAFDVDSSRHTWQLFIILGACFPATSAIVFWKETRFTNSVYALSAIWLGYSLYVAMAVCLTVIGTLAAGALGWQTSPQPLMVSLLVGASAYSLYGLWNAWNPIVKKVTVRISGLPPAWQNKQVVQLSDLHLGPIHRQRFASMVVKKANAQHPSAVFVTGDLFDGGGLELDKLADPLNQLQSTYGTFYITGNHETYVGVEKSLQALANIRLKILRDEKVEVEGLQILGIEYPLPNQKKDVGPALALLDRNRPNIVLYHEPKFINEFRAAGAHLVLCGHTHVGQMWPFGYITRKVYHGYDYGLHTEGTFNQYTSSGVGTWGPPMRTGNRPEIVVLMLERAS